MNSRIVSDVALVAAKAVVEQCPEVEARMPRMVNIIRAAIRLNDFLQRRRMHRLNPCKVLPPPTQ